MKHTEGPWRLEKDPSKALYHYHITSRESYPIAVVAHGGHTEMIDDWTQIDANAKLISKAPEMFELLKDILQLTNSFNTGDNGDQIQQRVQRLISEVENDR